MIVKSFLKINVEMLQLLCSNQNKPANQYKLILLILKIFKCEYQQVLKSDRIKRPMGMKICQYNHTLILLFKIWCKNGCARMLTFFLS